MQKRELWKNLPLEVAASSMIVLGLDEKEDKENSKWLIVKRFSLEKRSKHKQKTSKEMQELKIWPAHQVWGESRRNII